MIIGFRGDDFIERFYWIVFVWVWGGLGFLGGCWVGFAFGFFIYRYYFVFFVWIIGCVLSFFFFRELFFRVVVVLFRFFYVLLIRLVFWNLGF